MKDENSEPRVAAAGADGPPTAAPWGPAAPDSPAAREARETGRVRGSRASRMPKSEQTRTLILETALRLFQERGYDRTTMRAIAQEAGVSVGNAYYYFSSKEEILSSSMTLVTCPTCHGRGKIPASDAPEQGK